MKIKVITVATQENDGLKALRQSCRRTGMDITVLGLDQPWRGFGTKILLTVEYLRTLHGYTHFIFVDAYDTLFLKPITDYEGQIIFSAEKHKWPDPDAPYPPTEKIWAYLNSGSYIAPIGEYLKLIDDNPVSWEEDDQRYFTKLYLAGNNITLDTECKIFQSYAFNTPTDFTISDTFVNNITGTEPAVIHFNGKCLDPKVYSMVKFSDIHELQEIWENKPEKHREINDVMTEKVLNNPRLFKHREFIENNVFGFGERAFHWMWFLIIKEMPQEFTFLEIGVFKGQTLSLCAMLAQMHMKKAKRYGITPLSTEGGVWESDYAADIKFLHDEFRLKNDYIIFKGLSEDPEIIKKAAKLQLDILYIDGGHEERHITNDIVEYSHLVKPGGYMVIDDCCNSFPQDWGVFHGIEAVTRVVDKMLPPVTPNKDWEFVFSVVHNRVYRRVQS